MDERNNRHLALTLLSKKISENAEAVRELETKSTRLQNILNPNLTKYLGVYQTPTLAFLLEEWVDGPSLWDVLKKAPVSVEEALVYARAICGALEALHNQNHVHHNLAPECIRINERGGILVGGIANAQPVGAQPARKLSKYPPLYTSPEQIKDQPLAAAEDIYASAVILYQLISGGWVNGRHPPKSMDAIRRTHLHRTPPAPISLNKNIPDHFSRMVLWALRKNQEDRLKTTTELLSALALAARISVADIPLRATLETAPATAAILSEWQFLRPPKPNLLSQDAPPLEDRLASLSAPKKKKSRVGIIPPAIVILLMGFLSLFWYVRPAEIPLAVHETITPFALDHTPPSTRFATLLPKPADPHGGRIAFTCTRGSYNQLCMVNRDGTGLIQLTDMEASNYYPAFNPDGGSLLFASNRNGSFDLYLLLFSEKQLFQVTKNVGNVVSPDYSPDGRTIVFANRAGDGPTSIWMVNADGLNPRLVYAGPNMIVATAWSPDGEKIVYAMSLGIPQEYEIFSMDANGRNHLRISQGLRGIGGSVDWSPDGSHLLIHAGPFGNKDIFRLDAASGNFVQLTKGGNNAGASYSPDGRYIVFNSLRNDDQADLYIMRADGSNQVQLTNHPEPDWGARWVD